MPELTITRQQPAHEFRIVGLQVQRHIRGHPELATDQVGRAGLLHVPRDTVKAIPPPAAFVLDAARAQCQAQVWRRTSYLLVGVSRRPDGGPEADCASRR